MDQLRRVGIIWFPFIEKQRNRRRNAGAVCENFQMWMPENSSLVLPYPENIKNLKNSDALIYGGSGAVNPRVKMANVTDVPFSSVKIRVAPLSASIPPFAKTEDKTAGVTRLPKEKEKMVSPEKMMEAGNSGEDGAGRERSTGEEKLKHDRYDKSSMDLADRFHPF